MGPHLMRRAPKYVHGYIDQHGRPRHYFRRAGFKKVPLPGLPWSPEFMAAYEAALAGQAPPVGVRRTIPGTMRALAVSYYASPDFTTMRSSTQSAYRSIIDRFCREHGDKRVTLLQREHVIKLMATRTDKGPTAANSLRKVLKVMMRHAIEIGMRADDPTRDVRAHRVVSDGHHSWTEAEIELFEDKHPIGSKARLALALLLYSGQRRGDVVRMGRQHIKHGMLSVAQEKTCAALEIPVHASLRSIIDATPSDHLTFLTTMTGKPFSPTHFSHWFREQCDAAGLTNCSAHGLRKAAARRLAEAGCTAHEIASITGHASLKEIARYTAAADQKRLAAAAMEKVKARTKIGSPNR
jgi:integrase